jgi:hypothetical protein
MRLSYLFMILVWGEVCTRKGKIYYLDKKELLFQSPARSSSIKGTKVLTTTRGKGEIETKRPTAHPRALKQAEKEIRILEMKTTTPQSLNNLRSPPSPRPPSQPNHLKSLLLTCPRLNRWLCHPPRLPQKKLSPRDQELRNKQPIAEF